MPRRLQAAFDSLEGLSVGDALGERFFGAPADVVRRIDARQVPDPPWRWTDDTLMACSIVDELVRQGGIDEADLLQSFAARYDPSRGYGAAMNVLLPAVVAGVVGIDGAGALFDGQGSYGNGAAMRVAPLGAWYAGDVDAAALAADRAASATHIHPEGRAGAVGVAVAASIAAVTRRQPAAFLTEVAGHVPPGVVSEGLRAAAGVPEETPSDDVAAVLGSGYEVTAQDTVPFALWCAATALDDFEEAFWRTARGLGDIDTTCAIACGVVAAHVGADGVPTAWREAREPLPDWISRA